MRALFLLAVVLAAILILFRRRRLDFFTVGFVSSSVYYLPAFFGFAADVNLGPIALSSRRLEPEVYAVLSLLFVALGLGAWLFDGARRRVRPSLVVSVPGGLSVAPLVALVLASFGCLATFLTAGSALFNPQKAEVMSALSRWYPIWTVAASVALILAVAARSWCLVLGAAFLLALDVYVGFRNNTALATIGVFVLLLSGRGVQRLVSRGNLKFLAAGLLAGVFFFVYKGFYIAIKSGAWGLVGERLVDVTYFADVILYSSEPFLITGTLNEVVRSDFSIPAGHYAGLFYSVVPFAPALGAEVSSFNDFFQPSLFPEHRGGLASSFLAEAWSVGRWIAVSGAILLYTAGLWLGSRLLAARSVLVRAAACAFFPTWAFYIHRNDLLYQFVLQRRLLIVLIFAIGFSALTYAALASPRTKRGRAKGWALG